jgi:cytochrome c553
MRHPRVAFVVAWLTLALTLTLGAAPPSGQAQPVPQPAALPAPEPAPEVRTTLALPADAARGAAAYASCEACHRKDASGRALAATPRLAGQHATVIVKQLLDIRGGRRHNPKMSAFVAEGVLSAQDIADIAAHLQALPLNVATSQGPGDALPSGRQLYAQDCATCHGAEGQGQAQAFRPLVAGQHYRYLLLELGTIRSGERRNSDADMAAVLQGYSTADLEAVADYLSRLKPMRP